MTLSVLKRLLQIQRVLVRHGLDEYIEKTHLLRPMRWLFLLSPATWFQRSRGGSRGERLRLAFEELGPIFMKLGQVLSTRRDLLPPDIADELAKLQDRVPPFSSDEALRIVSAAYEQPVDQVFASFDVEPLAAATIAQVHSARLKSGREVVVKIVRPGIREKIERDLAVMYTLAELALRYSSEGHRLRPVELVREYEKTILDELDLMREAGNASQLKRNFAGSNLLYVPEVHWEYCRRNVMVMERIRGTLISNIEEFKRLGVNFQRLSENGVEIFFTQVFKHNFFHADMHPGNIFVFTENPDQPRYAAVDFGIVGTLDPRDQYYLAENMLAFFNHDYRRIAQLHIDSAWVPTQTRVDELESAIRTVCEPIFQKPLSEISFAQVLMGLFETARRFGISVQPQLLLLHKTLLQIEGLGRLLYPQLDLWKTAQPIMEKWMRERVSPLALLKRLHAQAPEIAEVINTLPQLLHRATRLAAEDQLSVSVQDRNAAQMREVVRESGRRRDYALLASALILGGILWFIFAREPMWPGALSLAAGAFSFWKSR
ncbi:MAG TPA: ubiquinone biosynthesis regulatory protein kinase UbiB [Steroidobacteraceae bacterium]|nr:ubiquinone biosynthesis regulatory protein kinase UbiB [Steroidobacteraceae bacterium]